MRNASTLSPLFMLQRTNAPMWCMYLSLLLCTNVVHYVAVQYGAVQHWQYGAVQHWQYAGAREWLSV